MCKGLTRKGLPCKSRARAEYCSLHLDQTPIALYTPPSLSLHVDQTPNALHTLSVNVWPTSQEINTEVSKIPVLLTVNELVDHLRSLVKLAGTGTTFKMNRLFVITAIELLKRNAGVCLPDPGLQRFVNIVVSKMKDISELAAYLEDFKRRCMESHRAAARKRVLSFYFKRCEDLCDDVIEKVLESV